MYVYYLYILYTSGKQVAAQGRGAPKAAIAGFLSEQRRVEGSKGALAALVGYSAGLMTFSKTALYCEFGEICAIGRN